MYQRIYDPSLAWDLYQAGLLIEHSKVCDRYQLACDWDSKEGMRTYMNAFHNYTLYVYIEE